MEGDKIMAEPTTNSFFQAIAGGGFATISYLVGGIDNLLVCFGIFMMIDFATGVMTGFSYKTTNSKRAFKGAAKKAAMCLMVFMAVQLDIVTGNGENFLRNSILMILIGTEGISILENFGKLGVPIPAILADSLEQLKEQGEKKEKQVEKITTTVIKEVEKPKEDK